MPKHDPLSEHSDSYDSSSQDSEHRPSLPWYRAGLAFECTGCGNCCSGPQTGFVWVDQEEIESIAQKIGMQDDLERFERKFVRNVGVRRSLVEYSDGDCIFLDPKTRGCSVYEVRPKQVGAGSQIMSRLQQRQALYARADRADPRSRNQSPR
jgi:Fe-S-cluster containining protein